MNLCGNFNIEIKMSDLGKLYIHCLHNENPRALRYSTVQLSTPFISKLLMSVAT